jgi:Xaa-Pro aminopeptidase
MRSRSPSRRQQEVYSAVHAALAAAVDAIRPGATNDDVAAAVRAAGEARAFGGRFLSLFIGHGIGIGANEPPYVGEALAGAETVELRQGMTMAVEPLIWVPGISGGGGVRLEDTIAVTGDSAVRLIWTPVSRRRWSCGVLALMGVLLGRGGRCGADDDWSR